MTSEFAEEHLKREAIKYATYDYYGYRISRDWSFRDLAKAHALLLSYGRTPHPLCDYIEEARPQKCLLVLGSCAVFHL